MPALPFVSLVHPEVIRPWISPLPHFLRISCSPKVKWEVGIICGKGWQTTWLMMNLESSRTVLFGDGTGHIWSFLFTNVLPMNFWVDCWPSLWKSIPTQPCCFLACAFGVMFKNIFPRPRLKHFPGSSLGGFLVLGPSFKSFIHLELLVYMGRGGGLVSCSCVMPSFPAPFTEETLFPPLCVPGSFAKCKLAVSVWRYNLAL